MATYIRFHTDVCDRGACQGLGVFHAVWLLNEQGLIEKHLETTLDETLCWFNRHLQVPRISTEERQCVFWFCADHQHFVHRLWDLVAILKEHNVDVRKIRTSDPGMIVYRDDYQVAAIPNRYIKSVLRV